MTNKLLREKLIKRAKELQENKELAAELVSHYSYYQTVAFGFIAEAVDNARLDGYKWNSIEELHKIICENYI